MNFPLRETDPELAALIQKELERQQNGLEMIPSENFASLSVIETLGTILTNKYSEGYPGKRYYGGNEFIDQIEDLARERAKELFGVEHANVQPYSGSPANLAVYFALLKPGDSVLGMDLAQGGHLTHGYKLNFSGTYYTSHSYGVDEKTHLIDYDAVRKIARETKPKMFIAGATAYPREYDFKAFGEIAKEVNAYFLADISHITGLVLAGEHQTPVPYADVVMTTAHKTLRGPRGALILVPRLTDPYHDLYRPKSKRDLGGLIDAAIIPGLQGGPHNHQTASIAAALAEAMQPEFKEYGKQIKKNAAALAEGLMKNGLTLISGGTDNHLILADVSPFGISGKDAERVLDSVGITVNKNMIPFDTRKPLDPSGIRMGTPALTSRGMKEDAMYSIAEIIMNVLKDHNDTSVLDTARESIRNITSQYPLYPDVRYV